jgi:hypothetical protein
VSGNAYYMPQIDVLTHSRLELTHEHIVLLNERIAEFRAADLVARKDIIEKATDLIQRHWREDATFDRDEIKSVSALLAALEIFNFSSPVFSACSPVPVRQH